MSPTAILTRADSMPSTCTAVTSSGGVPGVGQGGVYRGGDWVGTGEGYTGYPGQPSQDPIFSTYLALEPYLRPNEGNSECFMRFLR